MKGQGGWRLWPVAHFDLLCMFFNSLPPSFLIFFYERRIVSRVTGRECEEAMSTGKRQRGIYMREKAK